MIKNQAKSKRFNFMKVWAEQSLTEDFIDELLWVAKNICFFLILFAPCFM